MVHKAKRNKKFTSVQLAGAVAVIAVLILATSFTAYRLTEPSRDKARFAKAQTSQEELLQKIQTVSGSPNDIVRANSCTYASQDFQKGSLGCSVSIFLLFSKRDYLAANKLMAPISNMVGSDLKSGPGQTAASEFVVPEPPHQTQSFTQTIPSPNNLSCSMQYSFPSDSLHSINRFPNMSDSGTQNLQIEITCGGPAKAEHFPLISS